MTMIQFKTIGLVLIGLMMTPLLARADDIVIEVKGDVPGFKAAALSEYLAAKMQKEIPQPWHFAVFKSNEALPLNRIEWSFNTVHKVWQGGSHNGFPSPVYVETYLSSEAKLYINNAYQMTMATHPTVKRGVDDDALSEMVHTVAHALFVQNDFTKP